MFLSTLVAWLTDGKKILEISLAGFVTLAVGALLMYVTRDHRKEINKKEGYIVVNFGCIFMSISA